uniref:Uncharacterized protein n=1 Tax=Cacopsylla melanoneura TaxID=428564 RepID=A0A8D8S308_9HEMI
MRWRKMLPFHTRGYSTQHGKACRSTKKFYPFQNHAPLISPPLIMSAYWYSYETSTTHYLILSEYLPIQKFIAKGIQDNGFFPQLSASVARRRSCFGTFFIG